MARYLITYDLKDPGQNYERLIDRIKSCPGWAKICLSAYAVQSPKSAVQLRNELKSCLDQNDILFVCDFDNWASYNLSDEVSSWLG